MKSMRKISKSREEIRAIFREACHRRERLILVTPYLKFESNFIHLEDDHIHTRATMSKNYALYGLQTAELRLRFPYKMSFLEAPTKLLGYGEYNGSKTIRFDLPKSIYDNDERKSFRVEKIGCITATFSTPDNQLFHAVLNNISATGAQLMTDEDLSIDTLKVSDKIMLSIPLTKDIVINSSAIVHHMQNKAFGVEYSPKLPVSIMEPFSRWIFIKREEEREFIARQLEIDAAIATKSAKDERTQEEGGIYLITRDNKIDSALSKLLSEDRKFCRLPPAMGSLKDALGKKPHLIILHMADGDLEEKRLLKSLAESIKGETPILLLGTNVESELLFEVGRDLKVASSVSWTPKRSVFLQRLVSGMLRNFYGQGESPMAPAEAET